MLLLASGFVLSAAAQTPPRRPLRPRQPLLRSPAKIAVIAFQLAVAQTNEGQRDFADLQKKYAPKEATLKTLSDEIDSLTKQLQDQGATLSDVERANRAKAIDEKKKQLDRETEDLRKRLPAGYAGSVQRPAVEGLRRDAVLCEQQGFTLVLDISQQQSPVLYASGHQHHQAGDRRVQREVGRAGSAGAASAAAPPAPKPRPATPQAHPPASARMPPTEEQLFSGIEGPADRGLCFCRVTASPVENSVDYSRKATERRLILPLVSPESQSDRRSNPFLLNGTLQDSSPRHS